MGSGDTNLFLISSYQGHSRTQQGNMVGGKDRPVLKFKEMEEKHLHNLFLKNMSGLIEEVKNPTPRLNPNSKCGGMATHAGLAIELGITRKKSPSPGPTVAPSAPSSTTSSPTPSTTTPSRSTLP